MLVNEFVKINFAEGVVHITGHGRANAKESRSVIDMVRSDITLHPVASQDGCIDEKKFNKSLYKICSESDWSKFVL